MRTTGQRKKQDYLPPQKDAARLLLNLPHQLREQTAFVGFKLIPSEGAARPKKIPVVADNPTKNASSTNPATWRTFPAAIAGLKRGDFSAAAYCLHDTGLVGVDLDHALTTLGTLTPEAAAVVDTLSSYTERSISGTGLHCLIAGRLPRAGLRVDGVEIYQSNRFLICTGDRLKEYPAEIRRGQAEINRLLESLSVTGKESESPETRERMTSELSEDSVISESSHKDVVQETLPRQEGERNRCLFRLARVLKHDCNLAGTSPRKLKPIVRQWHKAALPAIGTKPFDETWGDFVRAWEFALYPLHGDLIADILARADTEPLPAAAAEYDTEHVQRLVAICYQLSLADTKHRRFFLSSHHAARIIGASQTQTHRWLQMLCADGVLKIEVKGNAHKATRYSWKGAQ